MGQYYMVRTYDEKTKEKHIYDGYVGGCVTGKYTGAKLMEHSWWRNVFVNAICEKIYKNPQRIAWVGDYADDYKFYEDAYGKNMHEEAVTATNFTLKNKFLVNHTSKEYVDCNKYYNRSSFIPYWDTNNWCVHPLPLLTAFGNGRGGGDYHGINEELVGNWGDNLISVEDDVPANYKEVHYVFKEES